MPVAALGLLCAIASAIGFAFKAVLVKRAYRYGVDPVTLLALRMLYALPFFAAMAAFAARREARPIARADWAGLLAIGFLGYYLSSYCDFLGLQYISAGLERVILYTYPTLVVLMTAAMHRRAPAPRLLAALGVSYAGVALAVWQDMQVAQRNLPLGVVLVLASAFSFALYLVRCAPLLQRLGTTRVTAWGTGFAALMVTLHFGATHPPAMLWQQPWPVHLLAGLMAVFCTVVPIWLNGHAIRLIGASRAAIAATLGPVFTLLLAWALLGEALGWRLLFGAALVIAGVRWSAMLQRRDARS